LAAAANDVTLRRVRRVSLIDLNSSCSLLRVATIVFKMHATAQCFAPGFFKRSLDEFKRLSQFGELPGPSAFSRRAR
jgi:hypothetical protein